MTAALSLRGRASGLVALVRARPELSLPVSVPLLFLVLGGMVAMFDGHYLDLEVYRLGVHAWLSGGDLYGTLPRTSAGVVLPFIYPPFAAILMVPLTVIGWTVAETVTFAVSVLALAVTLYVVTRRLWPSLTASGACAVTVALLVPSLVLEPVEQTFSFGQINLVLMAAVVVDCLVSGGRWPRGVLVGLAAAVKLTPAVFLLYFLLRRDHRAAAVTVLSGAVATGLGALVAPAASMRYWAGGLAGAGGVSGSPFFTNQTFQAVLVRAGVDGLLMKAVWLALSGCLVLLAAPAIRRATAPAALVVTAGVGLLVSPTSWSHHWVWIAPGLLVLAVSAARARSGLWAGVAALLAVTFVVAPHRFLPHDDGRELSWSPAQQVIGASYVIVTVLLYLALWWTWRSSASVHPALLPAPPAPARSEPAGSRSGRLGSEQR